MVGLLDIAPVRKKIAIRDGEAEVRGITGLGLVALLERFPEFRKLIADRAVNLTYEDILGLAPRVAAAIQAAGIGHAGDEKYETFIANELVIGEQAEIIKEVLDASFPKGFGALQELVNRINAEPVPAASDGSGKVRDTKLPSPSKPSSKEADTPSKPSGSTPPAS